MAADTWPAGLPQYLRLQGYAQQRVNDTIRSPMGYGPDKVRRRTTGVIQNVPGSLILTNAQKNTLQTFYITTLTGGSERFNWIDFLSGDSPLPAVEYRFIQPPTYTSAGNGTWFAVLALELLP